MGNVDKAMDKLMVSNVDVLSGDFSKSRVDFYRQLIHIDNLIKSDS